MFTKHSSVSESGGGGGGGCGCARKIRHKFANNTGLEIAMFNFVYMHNLIQFDY